MDLFFDDHGTPELSQGFAFDEVFRRDEQFCPRCAEIVAVHKRDQVSDAENALPLRLIRWQWGDSFSQKKIIGLELRAAVVCWATLRHLREVTLTQMAHGLGRKHKQSLGRHVDDFKRQFPQLRNPSMR